MQKSKTLRRKLFLQYSAMVLSIIVCFAAVFYFYIARTLRRSIADAMLQLCDGIGSELDQEYKYADALASRLLFSGEIKDIVYSEIYDHSAKSLAQQRTFYSLCYSMLGPTLSEYQVSIFNRAGQFIGTGATTYLKQFSTEKIQELTWLEACDARGGDRLFVRTYCDPLHISTRPVLSLAVTFSQRWGQPRDRYLEIRFEYAKLSRIVERKLALGHDTAARILIFDRDGALVYPFDDPDAAAYLAPFTQQAAQSAVAEIGGRQQTLVRHISDYTGFQTIMAQPNATLQVPINNLRNAVIALSIMALLLTLFVTYEIANRVTAPLGRIKAAIDRLTLGALEGPVPIADSGINELESLNLTVQAMCARLTASLGEAVAAKSAEIQSRMLALQSQMNPHFLYNTLSTISILAENGADTQIINMCGNLSDMMRYISSADATVTMAQELYHTHCYAALLQIRFGEDIAFVFDCDARLDTAVIPKLIVQPLIENCTKYATEGEPPWQVIVTGRASPERWTVTVSDSGAGFSPQALRTLSESLAEKTAVYRPLSLGGMGLANIYLRLQMYYGAAAVFTYGNLPDGGAFVTVGGAIHAEEAFDGVSDSRSCGGG